MKDFDLALKVVAEGLRTIAQGIEKIAEKLEESAPKTQTKAKRKAAAKPARKTKAKPAPKVKAVAKPKKAPAKKAPAKKTATAADTVLAIINRSKKGVDSATLAEKTGYDKKKIANIVFKLRKLGKIKSVIKGVYVKV